MPSITDTYSPGQSICPSLLRAVNMSSTRLACDIGAMIFITVSAIVWFLFPLLLVRSGPVVMKNSGTLCLSCSLGRLLWLRKKASCFPSRVFPGGCFCNSVDSAAYFGSVDHIGVVFHDVSHCCLL